MDNETPQPNNVPPANSQEPVNQTPTPAAGFGKGMRIIQPLDPNLKVDNTPSQPPAQPATVPPANTPQSQTTNTDIQPADATTQPPQPRANPNSIYPEATQGMSATSYQTPSPADNKKDTNESYNFNNGYSIGGSIFWSQLIAGIVLGLILFGIDSSVLKTATLSVIGIVSLLYYLVEFFVVAYIPYNTLKSSNIEEPLWLTTFGVAVQSIIIATLFELVISLIIRSVINHGVPSSLAHIGGAGLGGIAIVVYIGFFIASYFLTKLSWGIAFSLFGKIKNKTIVKAIGIGVIAIIVGGIAYHYLTLHSSVSKNGISVSTASTACQSNGLCNYKVSGTPSYSVDFYKGAKVINSKAANGQGLVDYEPTTLGKGVHISVGTAMPNQSCSPALTNSTFNIQVQGTSGTVCVFNNTVSNLISYTSYVQLNGSNYVITMISYSYQQSQETIQSIFNSIVIN